MSTTLPQLTEMESRHIVDGQLNILSTLWVPANRRCPSTSNRTVLSPASQPHTLSFTQSSLTSTLANIIVTFTHITVTSSCHQRPTSMSVMSKLCHGRSSLDPLTGTDSQNYPQMFLSQKSAGKFCTSKSHTRNKHCNETAYCVILKNEETDCSYFYLPVLNFLVTIFSTIIMQCDSWLVWSPKNQELAAHFAINYSRWLPQLFNISVKFQPHLHINDFK